MGQKIKFIHHLTLYYCCFQASNLTLSSDFHVSFFGFLKKFFEFLHEKSRLIIWKSKHGYLEIWIDGWHINMRRQQHR